MTLNYNSSLHPLIITPWLQRRQCKLCIHWWEISVMETRTRSVKWKIWVTMPVSWWDIMIKYVLNDVCQIIHSLNNLFHYLTQVSILRAPLTKRINQLIWLDWIPNNGLTKQSHVTCSHQKMTTLLIFFAKKNWEFLETNATTDEGMQYVARHCWSTMEIIPGWL